MDNKTYVFQQLKQHFPGGEEQVAGMVDQLDKQYNFNQMDSKDLFNTVNELTKSDNPEAGKFSASVGTPKTAPAPTNLQGKFDPDQLKQSEDNYRQWLSNTGDLRAGTALGASGRTTSGGLFDDANSVANNVFFESNKRQQEGLKRQQDLQQGDIKSTEDYNKSLGGTYAAQSTQRMNQAGSPETLYAKMLLKKALNTIPLSVNERNDLVSLTNDHSVTGQQIMAAASQIPGLQKLFSEQLLQGKTGAETGLIGAQTAGAKVETAGKQFGLDTAKNVIKSGINNLPPGLKVEAGPISISPTPETTTGSQQAGERKAEVAERARQWNATKPDVDSLIQDLTKTYTGKGARTIARLTNEDQALIANQLVRIYDLNSGALPPSIKAAIEKSKASGSAFTGAPDISLTPEQNILLLKQMRNFNDRYFQGNKEAQGNLSEMPKPVPNSIPERNEKGWPLITDRNGNKAYVNPKNRNQYEEVK